MSVSVLIQLQLIPLMPNEIIYCEELAATFNSKEALVSNKEVNWLQGNTCTEHIGLILVLKRSYMREVNVSCLLAVLQQ